MPSIDAAREEVQRAYDEVLKLVDSEQPRTVTRIEAELWTALLSFGRLLMLLFLARQVARSRPGEYQHAGRRWRLGEERGTELGTRFGKVMFVRPVGRDLADSRGACDLPVDRALGLCGGFSLGVVTILARLCAQMAFATARENFGESYEWAPSPRAILRMVDLAGGEARAFLEQAPGPDHDGELLFIQVDAKGISQITPEELRRRGRPHATPHAKPDRLQRRKARRRRNNRNKWPKKARRTKGKKSKNAKMAIVGVIYTLHRTPEGKVEGPINKRVLATFESHEALFAWLHREAVKRGYGKKRTVFLGDGSEHIWRLQQKYFPEAEVCIDWCHVVEKLWKAGECLYREGSATLNTWMRKQAARLRRGSVKAIIRELKKSLEDTPKTGPGNKGKRKRLQRTIEYLTEHKDRMRYQELRREDLDIGTGAVEGAVRNLVGIRLDGPGMRWSRQRSERVLHLRCIVLNDQWAEFAEYLQRRSELKLAAQPEPTTPYLAKAA